MGRNISQKEIQLTIQGQTISSNFGTIDSAQYNIEQLLNAGISNSLFSVRKKTVTDEEEALLQEMADLGYESYKQLKENPYFIQYLEQVSPLNFYMETNIGSRPAKRNKAQLNLDNLRAIPFVGAWSQLKQNVPGFYGVGTALRKLEEEGKFPQLKRMYQTSMFFETLIDNCEMAMKKCFFPLTAYLADHPQYGEIRTAIFEEFELTQQYIFKLTGNNELMSNYPVEQMSIQMRERIVLPLNTIQQYAISRLREAEKKPSAPLKEVYEKLIIRSSFGIINAARNSA
jgi:phosphoenolpyruvate carboxylase